MAVRERTTYSSEQYRLSGLLIWQNPLDGCHSFELDADWSCRDIGVRPLQCCRVNMFIEL
jgi:hypothetical protein